MSHFLNLSILLASALLLMAAREGQGISTKSVNFKTTKILFSALKCYQQPWMVNIIRQSTLHQHTNSSGEEFIKNSLADLLAGEMLSDKCPVETGQRCFVATECQVPTHKKILANAFGVRVPDDVLMGESKVLLYTGIFTKWTNYYARMSKFVRCPK
jgi:hypothetical protein